MLAAATSVLLKIASPASASTLSLYLEQRFGSWWNYCTQYSITVIEWPPQHDALGTSQGPIGSPPDNSVQKFVKVDTEVLSYGIWCTTAKCKLIWSVHIYCTFFYSFYITFLLQICRKIGRLVLPRFLFLWFGQCALNPLLVVLPSHKENTFSVVCANKFI